MKTILFIITNLIIGYSVLSIVCKKDLIDVPGRIGLSYILGVNIMAFEIFLMWVAGSKTGTLGMLLPWIFVMAASALIILKNRKTCISESPARIRMTLLEKMFICFIVFEIFYTFLLAMAAPIESYDSVAIWAVKSKIIYVSDLLPGAFFTFLKENFQSTHIDYPLLFPFKEVWFYKFTGGFNDYLVKMLFPMNFIAITLVFYSFVKKITNNRALTLCFTFILVSVKQFGDYAAIGYADFEMGALIFLTFSFLYMWNKYKEKAYMILACLFCVFAFFTKNEGAVIALMMLFFLFSFWIKNRHGVSAAAFFGILALALGWNLLKIHFKLSSDVLNAEAISFASIPKLPVRIIPILYEYQREFFGVKKWNIVWPMFFTVIFIGVKTKLNDEFKYMILPIAVIMAFYTAIYFITPNDVTWHLRTSFSRLLLHILPLAVAYISIITNDILEDRVAI